MFVFEIVFEYEVWLVVEIQCGVGQGFVYWQGKVIVVDVVFVVQCFVQGLVQGQIGVFDGVVFIDMQVIFGVYGQCEFVVFVDLFQYMVEEWQIGMDLWFGDVVQIDFDVDVGFFGSVLYCCLVWCVGQFVCNVVLVLFVVELCGVQLEIVDVYVLCELDVSGVVVDYC